MSTRTGRSPRPGGGGEGEGEGRGRGGRGEGQCRAVFTMHLVVPNSFLGDAFRKNVERALQHTARLADEIILFTVHVLSAIL